jgi:hypothetical protein
MVTTKEKTGVTMMVEILLRIPFYAGYEAGAEDAGSGELLAEAEALQRRSTTSTARQGGLLPWTSW